MVTEPFRYSRAPGEHLASMNLAMARWFAPRAYWIGAVGISVLLAVLLASTFQESALPPGGDPGNWIATSRAYLGHPYPSEIAPLSYPPVLFPLLGSSVELFGAPLGATVFAAGLLVALGLSTAALAGTMIQRRWIALLTVGALLANPSLLTMFFWGAYPNLLGFVFLNLALAGLLRAGQGHAETGAVQFWGFFALAALTHALVGVVLAGVLALYLVLGLLVPMPGWGTALRRAGRGTLEAPGLAARALFLSRGGRGGLLVFAAFVGGYYGGTYLLGIPHPYYFAEVGSTLRATSLRGALEPLLPGVTAAPSAVLGVLAVAAFGLLLLFAALVRTRPAWLSAPGLLLLAWPAAVAGLLVGGYLVGVDTDYHRFGYFFLVPVTLAAAFLAERIAFGPRRALATSPDTSGTVAVAPASAGPRWRRPRPVREIALAAIGGLALLLVLATLTVPALRRDESTFTAVGHDPEFVQAIRSIQASGVRGGILTVPAADQWSRGLTGMNSYAPYSSAVFLFYPFQEQASQLSFYALSGHYTLTNGPAVASVRSVVDPHAGGSPDYSMEIGGSPRELLRLPAMYLGVVLEDAQHRLLAPRNVTTAPTIVFPPGAGYTMQIDYAEPGWWLNETVSEPPGAPSVTVDLTASAAAPDTLADLHAAIVPPSGNSASVWAGTTPGTFTWNPLGSWPRPTTFGNVTPAGGIVGVTQLDPRSGGPAVFLRFASGSPNGSASLAGAVLCTTPSAGPGGWPGSYSAPAIWAGLGVRFVLWPSPGALPSASLLPGDEVRYLAEEYGLPTLYANGEWTVLSVPAGGGPSPGAPA
ncbi:MAG: hypothetical protein L3K08_00395 [Thermoplasmata archaeon]|nr:hypothetical protein [Thermoplasmata archaeon]